MVCFSLPQVNYRMPMGGALKIIKKSICDSPVKEMISSGPVNGPVNLRLNGTD
ncbi:hypothetical protein [Methanoplanus endosymbiosus]|uniref:Uncharacterized protein n=1 Tax=Methanoplanus endosymbiosus TaxID=33865 RepID=A0A9E7PNC2_9EURY|nr:hypothetical protein [Methanoplanus endosymbiosus]UUX91866.1 hypothetical protein L6E24_10915 [Methanoplanus endosymbiosus]